jgi:hypothetical protein
MSEQIRGPDGRYLEASSDIIGDDVPPTVWVNKTELVSGATAETPAPSDPIGKFNAAVKSAARDAAEKTKAASRLKSQLEQLEEDARAFGINAGDGSPSPRQEESAFFEKSISQLRRSIEEMSKEMTLLSPDSKDGYN